MLFCGAQIAFGMTSTNYQINWDSLNQGGEDQATSTNYRMLTTVGEPIAGSSSSTNYSLQAGYRVGDDTASLSLTVKVQDTSASTTYATFGNGLSKIVKVSATSSFAVGDYIAVVENRGFSELVAVGQITSISGDTMYVDRWDGDPTLMNSSVSGGDDFVYQLSGTNFSFGTLSVGSENMSIVMSSVQTNVSSYTVYLNAIDQFQDTGGSHTMTPVTDGTVSVGSEEYGVETIGAQAVNAGVDVGVTSTLQAVQTRSTPTGQAVDRIALLYKLSVTSSTPAGNYGQNVSYTLTKNY